MDDKTKRKIKSVLTNKGNIPLAVLEQVFELKDTLPVLEERLNTIDTQIKEVGEKIKNPDYSTILNSLTTLQDEIKKKDFRGLKGDKGLDGKNGSDGQDGKKGIDGINGKDGLNGRDGIDGLNGKDGKDGENFDTNIITKLEKKISDVENIAKINSSLPITTMFVNGTRAKNIYFSGATVTYNGDTANVSITSSAGGITTLNTLTASTQTFAVVNATSGANVLDITSATSTHTLTIVGKTLIHPVATSTFEHGVSASSTGLRNTFLGVNAGNSITSSSDNSGLGYNVLTAITSSSGGNTGVGSSVFPVLATANYNTGMGYNVFPLLQTGDSNVGYGVELGNSLVTGTGNILIGRLIASAATSMTSTTIMANAAGTTATSFSNTTLVGSSIGASATGFSNVIGIGSSMLDSITSSSTNTISIGITNLNGLTTGSSNTAIGSSILQSITTQSGNLGIGESIFSGATVAGTFGIGSQIGMNLSNGQESFLIGSTIITGGGSTIVESVAIGKTIFKGDATAITSSFAIGLNILSQDIPYSSLDSVYVGMNLGIASSVNTSSMFFGKNIMTVGSAGQAITSVFIGNDIASIATDPVITDTVVIGAGAGTNLSISTNNTIFGALAGVGLINGTDNLVSGYKTMQGFEGSFNVAIGGQALSSGTGDNNVAIGSSAMLSGSGSDNVIIGNLAEANGVALSKVIAIGQSAGASSSGSITNVILLGSDVKSSTSSASNEMAIGSTADPISRYWFGNGGLSTSGSAVSAITMSPTFAVGTNIAGASWTIGSGAGTGTGAVSSLIFQTPTVGTTGTTVQTLATRLTLDSTAATFTTKLTIPSLASSTTEGDFWKDSTQKSLGAFVDGIKQMVPGVLFTQTADKSVTNTTTETSIVGTGVGGLTLPANFFVAGKTIRITIAGVYSTVAVTGDTVTVKVKYGSTVLTSKATTALVTGGTNLAWEAEVLITCRTTGATGTVQLGGGLTYQIAGAVAVYDELNNGVATTTLDTTASSLLDITVTHSAANASNTVKSLVSSFEVLN